MTTCTTETGLFRKKPCGHVSVAHCLNCEQPLCAQHAVAEVSDSGSRTGHFMCQECVAAQKGQSRSMAVAAKTQEEKRLAGLAKGVAEKPAAPKAPPAHAAPAQPAPVVQPQKPDVLEFTPKDSKPG